MIRFVAMSLLLCCLANTGQAQLLKRIFGSSDCPNGQCPTANARQWFNKDGLSARQHVEQVHGVSTAGMSDADIQQHQNEYHNQYGSGHPVRGVVNAVVSVPRAIRENIYESQYPAVASSVGNGSSGGGSSGSLEVGKMYKGEMVVAIGEPKPAPELAPSLPEVNEAKSFGGPLKNRRTFKQVALAAAKEKLDSGEWDQDKYDTFRMAIRIPRVAREMEQALAEQAIEDGTVGALKDIDWDKLFSLIAKWLPVFLKLFMADNSQPITINAAPYVSIEKPELPSVFDLVFGDIAV